MAEHHSFKEFTDIGISGEPIPGETYRADGWAYQDFPKMLEDLWNKLLGIFGEGNYVKLTEAEYTHDGEKFMRGQLLISPDGMKNLEAYSKRTMN